MMANITMVIVWRDSRVSYPTDGGDDDNDISINMYAVVAHTPHLHIRDGPYYGCDMCIRGSSNANRAKVRIGMS